MPTPMEQDQYKNIQDAASNEGGEGEPTQNLDDIRTYVLRQLMDIGSVVFDEESIPESSTPRTRGVFYNLDDLIKYLDDGALIVYDTDLIPQPNPIITIHVHTDEDHLGLPDRYDIYIDEDTP